LSRMSHTTGGPKIRAVPKTHLNSSTPILSVTRLTNSDGPYAIFYNRAAA
jgi:hypothetical protein